MVAFSKLPVMMSDEDVVDKRYDNGKIYVVRCKYDDALVYVGSTIRTLEERFSCHKSNKSCSLYKYVNGDWDNWFIELYENYPCKNEYHLRLREGEVQREIATINKLVAGRSQKQWREDNREKISEKKKQYREHNREKVLEQKKQYRQNNREKCLERDRRYREHNREKCLERDRRYYEDNREKRLEYNKQYHEDNREKILEQKKEKIPCDHCGIIVNKCYIAKHKRTKKCTRFKTDICV
jgi:hypothetical protein